MPKHVILDGAALGLALIVAAPCLAQRGETAATGRVSAIQRLKEAEYADRMNSASWTSDNPTLDHYYDRKAAEVDALIGRLERGQDVAPGDVDRALDNSEAQRY